VRRLFAVLGLATGVFAASAFAGAAPASAHPLGNFTVNRYSGIVLVPGQVRIRYVVDMAEIPTFQEMPAIDANRDGTADAPERSTWVHRTAPTLVSNLSLAVDGEPIPLSIAGSSLVFRPGQAGLPILRLRVTVWGTVGSAGRVSFRDRNYPGRIGWKEVTARSEDGVALIGSDVPAVSVSQELLTYPTDLLSSPLDVSSTTLSFHPGRATSVGSLATAAKRTVSGAPVASGGTFASLVTRTGTSPPFPALTVLVALGLGALHAMGPGHGKTILAAYLVGAGARVRTVVAVGLAVSLMHTASVLALGGITLYASRFFPPDRIYPWLGLLSGVIVVVLGGGLLIVRAKARARGDDPLHPHAHPHEHDHHHAPRRGGPISGRGLAALAISGGILPSPTALVVLVAAVALHRLAYGLLLIAMFSVGLAAALTGVGLLALRARSLVSGRLGARTATLIPIASAAIILMAGLVLTTRAVVQLV
jgi:nickel/cobalt transporter (NicO) family protein